MSQVGRKGYGMFAKYHVFTVENGQLVPVKYPDPQRLEELPGYEREREKVIANTRALLAGMPANNVLLYGDAGTGKSSTVKAIANEFAPQGLRLVEVKKNQLYQIPELMDQLADNPLKFLLFIDDLSFTANDDNFAALKAILEGSVGGRAKNLAVYATSNRRHLVKETLTDRTGDDIHEADTRQELMSLSARFGLTVTFQRPEKARFEAILTELAVSTASRCRWSSCWSRPRRLPPGRGTQPPGGKAVHRAVRERCAEVNRTTKNQAEKLSAWFLLFG